MKNKSYISLIKLLEKHSVKAQLEKEILIFSYENKKISVCIATEDFNNCKNDAIIHLDQLIRDPEKVEAIILSKLKLNKTIYARSCEIKRVDKIAAIEFLETYHIMNSTQSAYNYGLYYEGELIALATFSKGRKMNRLKADQRSFELIRFCCKSGITVTGGLTRLIKKFCDEKKAGDVMTYVDKQLSDGSSFIKAGFKKHSETEPNYFLVNRISFDRMPVQKKENFDSKKFYLSRNSGNVKLVYTPQELPFQAPVRAALQPSGGVEVVISSGVEK